MSHLRLRDKHKLGSVPEYTNMSSKWQSAAKKGLKDNFQGDFFKDFYNSQGDYEDTASAGAKNDNEGKTTLLLNLI